MCSRSLLRQLQSLSQACLPLPTHDQLCFRLNLKTGFGFSHAHTSQLLLSEPLPRACGQAASFASAGAGQHCCQKNEKSCWFCSECHSHATHFCGNCGHVQCPHPDTCLFGLLGIEQSFDVDTAALDTAYKNLHRTLHPDKFARKTSQEKEASEGTAMQVNHAYSTLKSPLQRARYLMGLFGEAPEAEGTIQDPELLMEVMEARELVEETSDAAELDSMMREYKGKEGDLVARVSSAFKEREWALVRDLIHRLTYIERVMEVLRDKL